MFQIHPANPDADGALGFVNADGSDYVMIPRMTLYGMLPVWSPDGTEIAYRQANPMYTSTFHGAIAVVGQERACRWLGGNGRVRWMPDGSGVLAEIAEQQPSGTYRHSVASINVEECRVIDELYVTFNDASSPDLSSSGLLAFMRSASSAATLPAHEYSVVVVDLETQTERIVGKSSIPSAPSWSPDGQWLAYTAADGIYIVRGDGTEGRRVLEYCATCHTTHNYHWDDWPPLPEWSPDGRWLVYHREENGEYAIYKLNLQTGEEVLIVEGGLNPDWRATPAPTPAATP